MGSNKWPAAGDEQRALAGLQIDAARRCILAGRESFALGTRAVLWPRELHSESERQTSSAGQLALAASSRPAQSRWLIGAHERLLNGTLVGRVGASGARPELSPGDKLINPPARLQSIQWRVRVIIITIISAGFPSVFHLQE